MWNYMYVMHSVRVWDQFLKGPTYCNIHFKEIWKQSSLHCGFAVLATWDVPGTVLDWTRTCNFRNNFSGFDKVSNFCICSAKFLGYLFHHSAFNFSRNLNDKLFFISVSIYLSRLVIPRMFLLTWLSLFTAAIFLLILNVATRKKTIQQFLELT